MLTQGPGLWQPKEEAMGGTKGLILSVSGCRLGDEVHNLRGVVERMLVGERNCWVAWKTPIPAEKKPANREVFDVAKDVQVSHLKNLS